MIGFTLGSDATGGLLDSPGADFDPTTGVLTLPTGQQIQVGSPQPSTPGIYGPVAIPFEEDPYAGTTAHDTGMLPPGPAPRVTVRPVGFVDKFTQALSDTPSWIWVALGSLVVLQFTGGRRR